MKHPDIELQIAAMEAIIAEKKFKPEEASKSLKALLESYDKAFGQHIIQLNKDVDKKIVLLQSTQDQLKMIVNISNEMAINAVKVLAMNAENLKEVANGKPPVHSDNSMQEIVDLNIKLNQTETQESITLKIDLLKSDITDIKNLIENSFLKPQREIKEAKEEQFISNSKFKILKILLFFSAIFIALKIGDNIESEFGLKGYTKDVVVTLILVFIFDRIVNFGKDYIFWNNLSKSFERHTAAFRSI